jgi:hypothetical protein
MLDILKTESEPSNQYEVVYSAEMADKTPTAAILNERLNTALRVGTALGTAFVAVTLAVAGYFFTKINDHGEKLATIDGKVSSLSENVNRLLDRRSQNLLTKPNAQSVASNADDIKDAASWARQRKLAVPVAKLTDTAVDLLTAGATDPRTPDLWSALSEVVNYRTEIETGTETRITKKPCSASPPGVNVDSPDGRNYAQKGPFEYSDCYLNLDKSGLPPIVMRPNGIGILCKNCLVEYSGGPIAMKVQLFNCRFLLHLRSIPPESGLGLVRAVVENPKSVFVG